MATVELDPGVRLHAGPGGALLVGGQPLRVLRLNATAARLVAGWREPATPAPGPELDLAARLHTAGLAVLREDRTRWAAADVTVVVPVRDRATQLDRCLTALRATRAAADPDRAQPENGPAPRVLVVDDGSRDPEAVAAVAARHDVEVVVRPVNGGPAAARNTGLAAVRTPLVAFVDSDCRVPPDWLAGLLPVLGPPAGPPADQPAGSRDGTPADTPAGDAPTASRTVDVVAPRVVGAGGPGVLARFETRSGPLDLGPAAGPVGPGARVGHLPAAVLLCRRDALGAGFDETMRVGEDVDLVWRVADRGGPVRYEPRVVVEHDTRAGFGAWFAQRHGYGRGAAPLAARHPGRLAPAVVSRWSLPGVVALAARRPGWAAAATALTAAGMWTRLPAAPGRLHESVRLNVAGLGWTVVGLAEAGARPWLPALLTASLVSRRARLVTAAAVATRLHRARATRSPDLDPATWAVLRVADDLAYGTGVWTGALRARTPEPLLPRIT